MSRVASRGAAHLRPSLGMTGADLLPEATARIAGSRNIEHWQSGLARWDAEVLLAHALDVDIDSDGDLARNAVSPGQRRRFERFLARRLTGEPVNYITGSFRFAGLDLVVRPGVFSPRASSELTVDLAVRQVRRRRGTPVVVDIATGSGAIAIAVAARAPNCRAWGLDISAAAVRLGRDNARRLGLENVRFRVSDMLTSLPASLRGGVDLFTIHPPYVARHEVRTLPVEIRRFEPRTTLTDGSDDGLGLVRRLAAEAPSWLKHRGAVMVEVAPYLARATATVLRHAGLREVRSNRDSLGVTRVVVGRL